MALTLVRHTSPDVATGICYGQTDLALADSFEKEAELVASRLKPVTAIVSSPLERCYRLAHLLSNRWAATLHIEDDLKEMDFGTWENRPWADIPRTELDLWANDFYHARPHGGESVAMLQGRSLKALEAIAGYNEPTLVVTHAGVIKAAFATGMAPDDFKTSVEYGGHILWPAVRSKT